MKAQKGKGSLNFKKGEKVRLRKDCFNTGGSVFINCESVRKRTK